MIEYIKQSALAIGIQVVFLNSSDKIETQLNRVTRDEDNPTMLVSWDIDTTLAWNTNGILQDPSANIVALLVIKPETTADDEAIVATEEMSVLFETFLTNLFSRLNPISKIGGNPPVTNATYKRVPKHGMGKHSGVLGRWTQSVPRTVVCDIELP